MKHLLAFLLGLAAIPACAQFTIVVSSYPANTPANDPIHIAGDFQNWDPASAAHILTYNSGSDTYSIDIPANTGAIEFKFTRGSWTTVESNASGQFIANRTYNPTSTDTLFLDILGWEDLGGNGSVPSTAAANVSILSNGFHMTELNRDRKVWIYLPPDYDQSTISYPVLYMHNGQNVFDLTTSFAGEWEVDETLNALHAAGDPGIIVVAVDNGEALRIDEYAPWVNTQYGGGEGDAYVNFLVDDLKPYVDANYRTLPGREHTGIMGSSMGGHISTYAAIKHPDVFSKVGAFSPAYWINPELYNFVSSTGYQQPMRIYQLGGTLEGPSIVNEMHNMHDTLAAAGFANDTVLTIEVADGQHSEWFWAREFEAAYQWLYRSTDSTGTGIKATSAVHARLYPNPASNNATLELELKSPEAISIEVFDATGKLRYADQLPAGTAGRQTVQLPLAGLQLSAGMYSCRISTNGGLQQLPLVLTH